MVTCHAIGKHGFMEWFSKTAMLDILKYDSLVITKDAVAKIEEVYA